MYLNSNTNNVNSNFIEMNQTGAEFLLSYKDI